ncbi:MAG: hypothetical protein ACOX5G_05865 [Kiritimatiellia bacterium]|jgi:hypothetical protein
MKKLLSTVFLAFVATAATAVDVDGVWTSATSGFWDDPSAWTGGVPSGNGSATITQAGADYTVAVTSDVGTVGSLLVGGGPSSTTTLAVAAPLGVTTGRLNVAQGGVLAVQDGGVLTRTGPSDSAEGSLVVAGGGTFRVEDGGQAALTNLAGETANRHVYIGKNNQSGHLVMTGGKMKISSPARNNGDTLLFIGDDYSGTADNRPSLQMSGDAHLDVALVGADWYNYAIKLGKRSLVTMTDNALLDLHNCISAHTIWAGSDGTNSIHLSGHAAFYATNSGARISFGYPASAMWQPNHSFADISLADHAAMTLQSTTFTAGRNGAATLAITDNATLAVVNGYCAFLHAGAGLGGRCEINISGDGLLDIGTSARFGTAGEASLVGPISCEINQSGGVIHARPDKTGPTVNGIRMGDTATWTDKVDTNAYGLVRYNLSGGVISNAAVFVLGWKAPLTNELVQTGGTFLSLNTIDDNPAHPVFIGLNGGHGDYRLLGGVSDIQDDLFIGGISLQQELFSRGFLAGGNETSDGYKTLVFQPPASAPETFGRLYIDGGSMTVTNHYQKWNRCPGWSPPVVPGKVWVGLNGRGVIDMGEKGSLKCRELILTNATSSAVSFTFGETGVAPITVNEKLTIAEGAKLAVDVRGYKGGTLAWHVLSSPLCEGAFSPSNISVLGNAAVLQDTDGVWVTINRGTLMFVR